MDEKGMTMDEEVTTLETEMYRITIRRWANGDWDTETLTLQLKDGAMTTDTFKDARLNLFDGNQRAIPLLSVERPLYEDEA